MSELTLFYSGFSGDLEIRTKVSQNGDILISLLDVVHVLAKENSIVSNKTQAFNGLLVASIEVLEKDEQENTFDESGKHEVYVTEPGLYRIVSRDTSPASKKFQRWIFHEVLPSIRKYGSYPAPIQSESSELKTLVSLLQQNVQLLAKEIEHREALEKQVTEHDNRINKLEVIVSNDEGYMTIQNRLNDLEIDVDNIKIIWAWCEKIRLEHNYDCKNSNIGQFDTKYPIIVIDRAIGIVNGLKNLS
jgi:prophage antirepressor-like protein